MPVNKSYINVYTYFVEPTPENTKNIIVQQKRREFRWTSQKRKFFLLIFIFDSEVS